MVNTSLLMPFTFRYSDGSRVVQRFPSVKEAKQFAFNEGDHLVDWSAGDWSSA